MFTHHKLDIRDRSGDHICYISDLSKMQAHYPGWDVIVSLEEYISQIVSSWQGRES